MKTNEESENIRIEYKDNERAKEKFIDFMIDYFLQKNLFRKVDFDEDDSGSRE